MVVKDGRTPPYNYADPQLVRRGGPSFKISTQVYEGSNVLPLAYTYGSVISRDEYESFTPAQKQEALLQGVVPTVRRKRISRMPQAGPSLKSKDRGVPANPRAM